MKLKAACVCEDSLDYNEFRNGMVFNDVAFNKNIDYILRNVKDNDKIRFVYSRLYDYMLTERLRGECYSISAAMYIILCELGVPSKVWFGSCINRSLRGKPFYHSWVTINNKVVDLAIMFQLNTKIVVEPVLMGKSVFSLGSPGTEYGTSALMFHITYFEMRDCSISGCINNHTRFLWEFIIEILSEFGLNYDVQMLEKKYNKVYRTCC